MIVAAAVLAQPSASAQEKKVDKVRSESSFGTVVEQEKPLTRQQLRKQMMNDQVAYNLMRQQAMGEYAARPSVRFPIMLLISLSTNGYTSTIQTIGMSSVDSDAYSCCPQQWTNYDSRLLRERTKAFGQFACRPTVTKPFIV